VFDIELTSTPTDDGSCVLPVGAGPVPAHPDLLAEVAELLRGAADAAGAGHVSTLPRPLRRPAKVLLVGVGTGDEAGWRAAGAAAVRAVPPDELFQVTVPTAVPEAAVRGLAEGLWLAAYRYRDAPATARSAGVRLQTDNPGRYAGALHAARITARATWLARDLTNAPSSLKNPAWFAGQVVAEAAGRPARAGAGLTVTVREPEQLAAEGFGGLLAVGAGSASPPCLVELSWSPDVPADRATRHVVLVGKGITFDSGGISIKPRDAMKLMRKDMAGAAAVIAATLGAAWPSAAVPPPCTATTTSWPPP
jgi:leucyl aminopeptidase